MIKLAHSGDLMGELDTDELLKLVTINSVENIRRAAVYLNSIARSRGLQVALCSDIASKSLMTDANGIPLHSDVFGWDDLDERWWEKSSYALECPVPRACRYESEVFWCDRHGLHGVSANPHIRDYDLESHFDKFEGDYKAAIVIPVHLPFGQVSANSLSIFTHDKRDPQYIFDVYGPLFGVLIRQLISGYVKVKPATYRIPIDKGLNKRDVQCLRWLAMGKTDAEVAILLSLGRSTVRYHMSRVCEKLDAVNRTQAVFKAAQLGYITPPV